MNSFGKLCGYSFSLLLMLSFPLSAEELSADDLFKGNLEQNLVVTSGSPYQHSPYATAQGMYSDDGEYFDEQEMYADEQDYIDEQGAYTDYAEEETVPPAEQNQVILEEATPQAPENKYVYHYVQYEGNERYYILPSGQKIKDLRKTGPLHPTMYDLVRVDIFGELYLQNEDEHNGCNLEETFRTTIFPIYGLDVRRYLADLAAESCLDLPTAQDRELCNYYQNNPACEGAQAVALKAVPLPPGESYLSYQLNSDCAFVREVLLANTYVPKESTEWEKIEKDLVDDQRKIYVKELKQNLPVEEIRQHLLENNPNPTQRDLEFAKQEYIFEQGQNFTTEIPESAVQEVVQRRYAPFGVMENLQDFSARHSSSCSSMGDRYEAKVYGEITNIPAHLVLLFGDYVNKANHCFCH